MSDIGMLKALAEYAKTFNEEWFVEESKDLESVPTFSGESFIAAASPGVILCLIAEVEKLRADAKRYNHIAECLQASPGHYGVTWPRDYTSSSRAEVDAAIDAALEKRA